VADLEERRRNGLHRAVRKNERLVPGERGELVRRLAKPEPGFLAYQLAHARGELRMRVEAGADGGAADRQAAEPGQDGAQRGLRLLELVDVARELLPERERRRILEMRAA